MVVDDDDVAFHRAAAHLGDEAAIKLAALLPGAGVGTGIQFVPEKAGLGQLRELGSIPGAGILLPRRDGALLLDLVEPAQHRLIGQVIEFFPAEIIVASLHVAD